MQRFVHHLSYEGMYGLGYNQFHQLTHDNVQVYESWLDLGIEGLQEVVWAGFAEVLYRTSDESTCILQGINAKIKLSLPNKSRIKSAFGVIGLEGVVDDTRSLWKVHRSDGIVQFELMKEGQVDEVLMCGSGGLSVISQGALKMLRSADEIGKLPEAEPRHIGNIQSMTFGEAHFLALCDSRLYSWGSNLQGQLCRPKTRGQDVGEVMGLTYQELEGLTSIASGGWMSGVVLDNHEVVLWGWTREADCIEGIPPESTETEYPVSRYWINEHILQLGIGNTYIALLVLYNRQTLVKITGKLQGVMESAYGEWIDVALSPCNDTLTQLYCTKWNIFVS